MPDVPSCNIYPLCSRALRIHFLVSSTRDLQALRALRALHDPRALRSLYIPSRLTFFARLTWTIAPYLPSCLTCSSYFSCHRCLAHNNKVYNIGLQLQFRLTHIGFSNIFAFEQFRQLVMTSRSINTLLIMISNSFK